MVLNDEDIEEYIKLDLAEMENIPEEEKSPYMQRVIQSKLEFRENMCQKVSILRLGYMFKVLRAIHPGKANMLSAEAFKVKVIKLESAKAKRDHFKASKMMD